MNGAKLSEYKEEKIKKKKVFYFKITLVFILSHILNINLVLIFMEQDNIDTKLVKDQSRSEIGIKIKANFDYEHESDLPITLYTKHKKLIIEKAIFIKKIKPTNFINDQKTIMALIEISKSDFPKILAINTDQTLVAWPYHKKQSLAQKSKSKELTTYEIHL